MRKEGESIENSRKYKVGRKEGGEQPSTQDDVNIGMGSLVQEPIPFVDHNHGQTIDNNFLHNLEQSLKHEN